MRGEELRAAIQHLKLSVRRPRWWYQFLRHGRVGLLREIVVDSLEIIRKEPVYALTLAMNTPPTTPLGRMGAPQEYLYRLVRATRPAKVVETGVYRGISTAFILGALHANGFGRLYSIDLPSRSYVDPLSSRIDSSPLSRSEEVGFAVPYYLRGRWDVRFGDVRTELPRLLREQPSINMFYHDSEHTYDTMTWEYEQALPHLHKGGLLTSDDTNWNSAFRDFARLHGLDELGLIMNRLGVARVSGQRSASEV